MLHWVLTCRQQLLHVKYKAQKLEFFFQAAVGAKTKSTEFNAKQNNGFDQIRVVVRT